MDNEALQLDFENLAAHPQCPHGPTILFRKTKNRGNEIEVQEYYACAAYRDKKGCSFYMEKDSSHQNKDSGSIRNIKKIDYPELVQKDFGNLLYCYTCDKLDLQSKNHAFHETNYPLSSEDLEYPTKFLNPLSTNKNEAQYFFTNSTLNFLAKMLHDLNIEKVLCIGAPRLHEFLTNNYSQFKLKSILLDIDRRFGYFYNKSEFYLYNMFNDHFFGDSKQRCIDFENELKETEVSNFALLTDPPFGCRTELLTETIKKISVKYRMINHHHKILPIFWIFPYYMETYIKNGMPEMKMLDYKVNYTNHENYTNNGKLKNGSPIRIFTNVPLNKIALPPNEGYKFCKQCNKWTFANNLHCIKCKLCPSKNGFTYRHCESCGICVKPSYEHCIKCNRCAQVVGHNCEEYQKNLTCMICLQKGHIEVNCQKWKKHSGASGRVQKLKKKQCLLCKKLGHNENNCRNRKILLVESVFMGQVTNILTES